MAGPESEQKGPEERFGRYAIYGKIAAGGMASVYLARDEAPEARHRWVAIKRVHPHLVSRRDVVQMFLNEAKILSRLDHPNICPIIDYGVEENAPYIAMRYLHGAALSGLLRRLVEQKQPLPVNLMAWVAACTCDGLHYAHEAVGEDGKPLGLVHRDISPQNIFITFEGGVSLLDFGVAKAAGFTGFTRTGHIKGKYAYMSPEQVEATPLDRRSDVFSLGIVLWESLAGRHLFRRKQHIDTLRAIARTEAQLVTKVNPSVPDALASIIARALKTDRRQRYQTAKAMGTDLWAYLAREDAELGPSRVAEVMKTIFPDRRHPSEAQGVITQPEALGIITETEARAREIDASDEGELPLSMPDAEPIAAVVETQPDVTAALSQRELFEAGPDTLRPLDDDLSMILERTRNDPLRDSTDPEVASRLPGEVEIDHTLNDRTGVLLAEEMKLASLARASTAPAPSEEIEDATVQLTWLRNGQPDRDAEPNDARTLLSERRPAPIAPHVAPSVATEETAEETPFPVLRGYSATSSKPATGIFDPATAIPFRPSVPPRLASTATLGADPLPTPRPAATAIVDFDALSGPAPSRRPSPPPEKRSHVVLVVTCIAAALTAFTVVAVLVNAPEQHDPAPAAIDAAVVQAPSPAIEPRKTDDTVTATITTIDPLPPPEKREPAPQKSASEAQRDPPPRDPPPRDPPPRDPPAKKASREIPADKRLRARALESEARRALFSAGDRAKAERLLNDCLKLAELPTCHRTLAVLHAQAGDRPKALEHYRRYLELAPEAADAPVIRRLLEER